MNFDPPLQQATMLHRYKRFLVDARLADGTRETLHCANTGAMLGCVFPGLPIFYSISDNPKRKLRCSVELVQSDLGHLICVNTARANQVVKEALAQGSIPELAEQMFKSEVKIPDESGRFDFGNDDVFVEVKSVTYLRDDIGVFPDARSERATKHVKALQRQVGRNARAILLFCVPHTGIEKVGVAADIDPVYAVAVAEAMDAGVEVLAYRCDVTPSKLALTRRVPFLSN